jgi:hypothetical protein
VTRDCGVREEWWYGISVSQELSCRCVKVAKFEQPSNGRWRIADQTQALTIPPAVAYVMAILAMATATRTDAADASGAVADAAEHRVTPTTIPTRPLLKWNGS